jgi:Fe-S oxidoreductase
MLNKSRIDYRMMDDEWCCGAPLLDLGSVDGIARLVDHHLEQMKKMKIRKVVFLCPHCQETFRNVYPQVLGNELELELIFITKYLRELIENKKMEPSKAVPLKMSYHDPCYLGRYLGDFDSARDILQKIPALEVTEMRRNREDSYCCGGGGGVKFLEPENAMAIGQERARDFMKTGAEVLATSCPLCKWQFRDVHRSLGRDIVVKDVVEILRLSLE